MDIETLALELKENGITTTEGISGYNYEDAFNKFAETFDYSDLFNDHLQSLMRDSVTKSEDESDINLGSFIRLKTTLAFFEAVQEQLELICGESETVDWVRQDNAERVRSIRDENKSSFYG